MTATPTPWKRDGIRHHSKRSKHSFRYTRPLPGHIAQDFNTHQHPRSSTTDCFLFSSPAAKPSRGSFPTYFFADSVNQRFAHVARGFHVGTTRTGPQLFTPIGDNVNLTTCRKFPQGIVAQLITADGMNGLKPAQPKSNDLSKRKNQQYKKQNNEWKVTIFFACRR
jgi:hypothetical protein